jgi:hypothetical protein
MDKPWFIPKAVVLVQLTIKSRFKMGKCRHAGADLRVRPYIKIQ